MSPTFRASPNFGPRKGGLTPTMVVIHYTAMPDTQTVVDWLCNPAAQVSAHYVVSPKGEVTQLVEEADRAWHAGASRWGALEDVNSASIGIELVNGGSEPFAAPLMEACERLVRGAMARWSIPPERVVGHSDVAPGRKIDPGVRFDWRLMALLGLAVWPKASEPVDGSEVDFLAALNTIGYTAEAAPEVLLAAFRARVRPAARGPLDGWDIAMAQDLACRYPVDAAPLSA